MVKLLSLLEEVAASERLLQSCEAALTYQHESLQDMHNALLATDKSCKELRDAAASATAEAAGLRRTLKEVGSSAAQHSRIWKQDAHRGDALRAAAARIYQQREADHKPFQERSREWDDHIHQWFEAGVNKDLDPIIYNQNRSVLSRTRELLTAEFAQRELHDEYRLVAEGGGAGSSLETSADVLLQLRAQIGQLEEQHAALIAHRADFSEALIASLSPYLRDGLGAKAQEAAYQERECLSAYEKVRDLRAMLATRGQANRDAWSTALRPLLMVADDLSQTAASVEADSKVSLADEETRWVLQSQQKLVSDAQAAARREAARREKLAKDLEEEVQAHEKVRGMLEARSGENNVKSLAFGEREYFQERVAKLEGKNKGMKEEMSKMEESHESELEGLRATADTLADEIDEQKRLRGQMALSLAQYASLEAEWGRKDEEGQTEINKLSKEYKGLRKRVDKLPQLEEAYANSSIEMVKKLRREVRQLEKRLSDGEESLGRIEASRGQLQAEGESLQAEGVAATWAAKEEYADVLDKLERQTIRLKEGLAQRVLRLWVLRGVSRCLKHWRLYVIKRSLRREMRLPVSERKAASSKPPTQAQLALEQFGATLKAIPELF